MDLEKVASHAFTIDDRPFAVDVVDPVTDYMGLMEEIFDFPAMKALLAGGFKVTANAMHGGKNLVLLQYSGILK